MAAREDLCRVHRPDLVDELLALDGCDAQLDEDTGISPGSIRAARRAAGAAVEAGAAVAREGGQHLCLVRPPGHHAEPGRSMGFCLFNNLALAIASARGHGMRRVMVLDWDVHHGNGTQEAFWSDPDVLVVDLHQRSHYPGTGAATETGGSGAEGRTVNVPLPPGCGDRDYLAVFDRLAVPLADAFVPELVCVAAGFDAHADDPLGDMRVSDRGFGQLAARTRALADRHAHGRLLLTLEGGYELAALGRSVGRCVDGVLDGPPRQDPPMEDPHTRAAAGPARVHDVLEQVARIHGEHWPLGA